MRKIIKLGLVVACGVAFAADPNPFANYTAGTASSKENPSLADWHNANRAAIEAETAEAKLAEFAASAESAKALLAKVKPAYATCPMVAVQIAAVSQYVRGQIRLGGSSGSGSPILRVRCGSLRSSKLRPLRLTPTAPSISSTSCAGADFRSRQRRYAQSARTRSARRCGSSRRWLRTSSARQRSAANAARWCVRGVARTEAGR